uniref:Glycosyltransferase 8 domain containing 2 n=1 Tax=Pavo cristatus TaxID=9049 RepID=A0A8C9EZL1_PAVCR
MAVSSFPPAPSSGADFLLLCFYKNGTSCKQCQCFQNSNKCYLLHNSVFLGYVLSSCLFLVDDLESPKEMEEEIPVVICAAAGRMGATVAAISSIYSNTEADVLFYIVGLKNTIPHIRKWIENSKLKEIKFKTVEFNPMVLKGKIRQDASRPELLQPVRAGRDVSICGDIQNPTRHSPKLFNTYMGFLDYRKQAIRDLGISPSTCSFNPGVIVANMTEWKNQRLTKQLEKWMQRNVEENLYSSTLGGGVATSPMLIVFHGKHSTINPMWHIRHLGMFNFSMEQVAQGGYCFPPSGRSWVGWEATSVTGTFQLASAHLSALGMQVFSLEV